MKLVLGLLVGLTVISPATRQTAVLSGEVISSQNTPIAGAIVTATTEALPTARSVVTDSRGQFVFMSLPQGRFAVTATKATFLSSTYGAVHHGRPGIPVVLPEGGRVSGLKLQMVRGGVISGTVRSADGQPVLGVTVTTWKTTMSGAWTQVGESLTDDRGEYRQGGLARGEYVAAALPKTLSGGDVARITADEFDARLRALQAANASRGNPVATTAPKPSGSVRYVPVFSGNTFSSAEAQRMPIVPEQEYRAADLVISLVPTTHVSGRILQTDGRAAASYPIRVIPDGPLLPAALGGGSPIGAFTDANGRFTFRSMPPGRFVVESVGSAGWAVTSVSVNRDNVSDLTLSLQPYMKASGRIVFDTQAMSPRPDVASLRVTLTPSGTQRGKPAVSKGAALNANASFEIAEMLPGSYDVSIDGPGLARWRLTSVLSNAREMMDTGLEIKPGESLTALRLELSDRHSELAGTLQTLPGLLPGEFCVVAFAADASLRTSPRRLASARPATDGSFSIADLPAGQYLVAVLTDCDPEEWRQTGFLDGLVPSSINVTVSRGRRTVQDLRVTIRK